MTLAIRTLPLVGTRAGAVHASRTILPAGTALWITPSLATIRVGALSRAVAGFVVRVSTDASAGDPLDGIALETH